MSHGQKSSAKFCEFHNQRGHDTNECYDLKREIETTVKTGQLSHLIKEVRGGGDQNQATGKAKEVKILTLETPDPKRPKHRHEAWANKPITFPPMNTMTPTVAPVIIRASMVGLEIYRVYIDSGSSADIMYEQCFRKLPTAVQKQLETCNVLLSGFSGTSVHAKGKLALDVTIGKETARRTERIKFLVVGAPSRYNILMGRTFISTFGAVASEAHGIVIVNTPIGQTTIQSEPLSSLLVAEVNQKEAI